MRSSILALTSCGLVVIAGAVVASEAVAQEMPTTMSAERIDVVVEPGDTVYALGRRFDVAPADIISANDIQPPYQLQVGQKLVMPVETAQAAPQPKTAKASEPRAETAAMSDEAEVKKVQVSATSAPTRLEFNTPAAAERDVKAPAKIAKLDAVYTVQPGDTMYSLARRFGLELTELAAANEIDSPYTLSVDQRIIIPGALAENVSEAQPAAALTTGTIVAPATASDMAKSADAEMAARELGVMKAVAKEKAEADDAIVINKNSDSRFSWPLRGSIVENYGRNDAGIRNDGINIAAPVGAPIRASADGQVIYTGAELEGYGNLLLVRHEDGWVSAYAHADKILVKKGDTVRQGQVVAKVGRTGDVDQPQLHFELRHELQPRDPLAALEGRDIKAAALD